jgi:predicted solute-binding protein
MSYVLADQHGWLKQNGSTAPFEVVVAGNFESLRTAVRSKSAEFFMWEHFTTKHYWDNGELKRIGEIYTPWPSWMITARKTVTPELAELLAKISQGVQYYLEHPDEAVDYISTSMQYSEADAKEWMKTVSFAEKVDRVDSAVVRDTVASLQKAGVLNPNSGGPEQMILKL